MQLASPPECGWVGAVQMTARIVGCAALTTAALVCGAAWAEPDQTARAERIAQSATVSEAPEDVREFLRSRTRVYRTVTADRLSDLIQRLGAQTRVDQVDGVRAVRVTTPAERQFLIRMLGCNAEQDCEGFQIFGVFVPDRPVGTNEINVFNQRFPFAKAVVLDNGYLAVEWSVTLTYGMTEGNMLLNVLIWDQMATELVRAIVGYRGS